MTWFGIVIIVVALVFGVSLIFGAPFVPSRKRDIRMVLGKLYKNNCTEGTFIDMGSGSGTVLDVANSLGFNTIVGYEINPIFALMSKIRFISNSKVCTYCCNGLTAQWPSDTSTVYIFGIDRVMKPLLDKAREHASLNSEQITVISYGFRAHGIEPTQKIGPYLIYRF